MELPFRNNVYMVKSFSVGKGMILPPKHSLGRELKRRLLIIKWCLLNYICTGLWISEKYSIFHNLFCPPKEPCEVVQAGIFVRGKWGLWNSKVDLLKLLHSTTLFPRGTVKREIKCLHSEHSRITSFIHLIQTKALVPDFHGCPPHHTFHSNTCA